MRKSTARNYVCVVSRTGSVFALERISRVCEGKVRRSRSKGRKPRRALQRGLVEHENVALVDIELSRRDGNSIFPIADKGFVIANVKKLRAARREIPKI